MNSSRDLPPTLAKVSVTSMASEADLIQRGEHLTARGVVPCQMTLFLRCATYVLRG